MVPQRGAIFFLGLVSLDCSGHRLKGMWIRLHTHEKGSDLDKDHGDHFFKGLMILFFFFEDLGDLTYICPQETLKGTPRSWP